MYQNQYNRTKLVKKWDPVATLTKLGWTITLPGQEFDVSAMLLPQTAQVDNEELCKLDFPWSCRPSGW